MNTPLISIVVTNYAGTSDLELALSSLLKIPHDNIELIVADCCTPNFDEWIEKNFPKAKYIHFSENIGIGGLRNAGFKLINKSSEYVCYIDDDIIVTPDFLENLLKLMETNTDIGAVHPVRFNYIDKSRIDSLGNLMTRTGFPYKIETTEENLSKLKSGKIMDIFYGETAAMLVRTRILLQVAVDLEPFDKDNLFAWEDVDLCWRIWLLNYRVVVTSYSSCYHNIDTGTRRAKKYDSRYTYLVTRGRFISMIKNYELSFLIKYLPIAVMIDLAKAMLLLYYEPNHATAAMKGLVWWIIHIRYMMKKRYLSRRPLVKRNNELQNIFIKTSPRQLVRQFKHNWI